MLFRRLSVAWLWFFLLLTSYYILKPVRDGTISSLAKQLEPWYLATFIFTVLAMTIYTHLYARLTTTQLVFTVYQFFAVCCLTFAWLFRIQPEHPTWLVGSFFIWVSVFNVCSVAVFWSVATDLFHKDEAKVWFGVLAGAGSVGALVGSLFTLHLTSTLGHPTLLLTSFAAIEVNCLLACGFIWLSQMAQSARSEVSVLEESPPSLSTMSVPLGSSQVQASSLWDSMLHVYRSPYLLSICGFVLFGKFVATFVYNNLQLEMGEQIIFSERRTELFAQMNLATQIGSAIFQYLIVGLLISQIGLKRVLVIPAGVMLIAFSWLYFDASLSVLMAIQVIQQVLGYGIMSPSQNVLFSVVSREDKYIAKGFIDTIVFRLSDTISSSVCSLLRWTMVDLSILALALLPVIATWCLMSHRLGNQFRRLDQSLSKVGAPGCNS